MKLWMKIYFFSLLLLIVTLNASGFILIQKMHNDILMKEVEKCIAEESFSVSELRTRSVFIQNNYNNTYDEVSTFIYDTLSRHDSYKADSDRGSIEVLDYKNNILYSDAKFPSCSKSDELENLKSNSTKYIIRTINKKQYLYIASLAQVYNFSVKVHYAKDISNIYIEKNKNYMFFGKFDILICSVFAVFMFFISRMIAKPVNVLKDSAKKIADGKYSERVNIKSKDEFKELGDNFNLMAETIEDKIKELEKSNDAKETFINNFTHELKTPLTSIIGYANLIRTSKYDEELFLESADYIYKEGKRLEQMSFKLMDLIYAKNETINLKPENIIEIIKEVKDIILKKFENKNIDIIIKGEECILNVDRDLIKTALGNLIENAVKASYDNSKVYVEVIEDNGKTIISIQDTGIGIPKEHLDKICQPFYMVDKARSRKNNGAGIGLSICEKIAEAHNAEMKIKSEEGKGTKVFLIFNNRNKR